MFFQCQYDFRDLEHSMVRIGYVNKGGHTFIDMGELDDTVPENIIFDPKRHLRFVWTSSLLSPRAGICPTWTCLTGASAIESEGI
jgi:hypothetical protein